MSDFKVLKVNDFNLDLTLNGGQTFVWDKINDIWYGKTSNGLILLRQPKPDIIEWKIYNSILNDKVINISKYLRTDFDYPALLNKTSTDKFFTRSLSKYRGMRLLLQDPNEIIISFIISANNNYKKIKGSIKILSQMFGEKITVNGYDYFLFPRIEKIASANVEEIKNASLGYRTEYVLETSQAILENIFDIPNRPLALQEEDLRNKLFKLKGVGNKVADCILTFGYGFDNIAPVDVWVGRVLNKYYGLKPGLSYKELRKWTKENMYGYASWVSQYLFEYIRSEAKKV